MKQNKYDDNDFFISYGEMPRSMDGLKAAGEWHILKKMLPDFNNKNVLDLGCGYGWHSIFAKKQGAKNVVGIDLSQKMINRAIENSNDLGINFRKMAIEDMDFKPDEYDIIISSLALHYIKDLKPVFTKINQILKNNGDFVFSMEHPIFTSRSEQDWIRDHNGKNLYWPIDRYTEEGIRETRFLGHGVIKYHRTLETIINTLIDTNFLIHKVSESKPSLDALQKYPEMKDEFRRPMFIIVSAKKIKI